MSKTIKKNTFKLSVDMLPAISRLFVLIVIVLLGSAIDSSFLSIRNISNNFTNASILIILGIGQTIAIITNGPDLSSGSVMTISAVVSAIFMKSLGVNFLIAILVALVIGGILGAINGFMIAHVGIPSFISTYGLQWAVFGFAYLILHGYVIYDFDKNFRFIGNGVLFGYIQMPVVVMIITAVLGILLLKKTTFGRQCYAVGSNRISASMSGINSKKIIVIAFIISGVLSAFAGILFVSRMNAVQADIGNAYLLPVLATVYMGGTSASGGEGGIFGTVVGALIITMVNNCMNLLAVPSEWKDAVIGILIIATVLLDTIVKKRIIANKQARA
jgi:ribose transport system permease protein